MKRTVCVILITVLVVLLISSCAVAVPEAAEDSAVRHSDGTVAGTDENTIARDTDAADTDIDATEPDLSGIELPSDFAFSLVWNTFGISSYDSQTGKLVKTTDASEPDRYICFVQLSENDLKRVYQWLCSDIDLSEYPSSYDPYNDPDSEMKMVCTPSQTIVVSVTANGTTTQINCREICYESEGYCDAATAFLGAVNRVVSLLTSLPEWKAFPEYEYGYD